MRDLEDALEVDAARDFFDQNRRQTLAPKLLVHAQEVDLHRRKLPHPHDMGWYASGRVGMGWYELVWIGHCLVWFGNGLAWIGMG